MDNNNVIEAAADTEAPDMMGASLEAAAHATAQSKVNSAVASDPARPATMDNNNVIENGVAAALASDTVELRILLARLQEAEAAHSASQDSANYFRCAGMWDHYDDALDAVDDTFTILEAARATPSLAMKQASSWIVSAKVANNEDNNESSQTNRA